MRPIFVENDGSRAVDDSSLGTLSSHDSTTSRMLWLEDAGKGLTDDSNDFERPVHSVNEPISEKGLVEDLHDFGRPVYSVSESMSCSSLTISVIHEPHEDNYCKYVDSTSCIGSLPYFQHL